jgi:pyridoxal phosphate enzyme (YggS family)
LEQQQSILARITANLSIIRENIRNACNVAGRSVDDLRLIAVSKTVLEPQIAAARELGLTDFGENRSSLLVQRQQLFSDCDWHFIGRVQTNKLKQVVGTASLIHSIASKRALLEAARCASKLAITQDILFEVNISGEDSKDGATEFELPELIDLACSLDSLRVLGLMTMAPQGEPGVARRCFARLRRLRDDLRGSYSGAPNIALSELSMGMSEDYLAAVEEGATLLRIGRSIWS